VQKYNLWHITSWVPQHFCTNWVGKPIQNAAQLCAKAEGCVNDDLRSDKLWKGWGFWVGTWNVDSLIGRAGEVSL